MAEKESLESLPLAAGTASRGERLTAVERPVEGRFFMIIVKSVFAINIVLILLNFSTQWKSWGGAQSQTSKTTGGLQHDVLDIGAAYPRLQARPHKIKHWTQMTKRQAPPPGNASSLPIQTFSVDVPLLGPDGKVVGAGTPDGFQGIDTTVDSAAASCQVTLGVNVFANSFGQPFVGDYTPPACLGDSNTVIMNLTVQSKGRQFDRLAIVWVPFFFFNVNPPKGRS